MKNLLDDDTMVAISTAHGAAAIGIIRLSGKDAFRIIDSVFVPLKEKQKKIAHKLIRGTIQEQGIVLDEAMVSYGINPRSYTGEDMVEIYAHGGTLVLSEILNILVKYGARLAEPGEFTFRAFLNGKINLTQAEAVMDVIHAKNKQALGIAQQQLQGKLSNEITHMRESLLEVLAHTEAAIDFSTEDIDVFSKDIMAQKVQNEIDKTQMILNTYVSARHLVEGIKVAIIGRPNVGKSSLLNAFLNSERAIVTEEEGTTRDTVEEELLYKGIIFRFIDTAGIRDAHNQAEKIGIEHSFEKMKTADLVLVVIDGSAPLSHDDRALLDINNGPKKIIVLNKIDIPQNSDGKKELEEYKGLNIEKISALKKEGTMALIETIYQEMISQKLNSQDVFLTKERHKISLENAQRFLENYIVGLKESRPLEFLALDLRSALNELALILGQVTTQDVYDKIFSSFCIGK